MPPRPFQITIVCLGNICRSPMAEAVVRDRLARAGLTERVAVDSAGTGDWHLNHDADPRAKATLTAAGYTLDHRSRQIDRTWFDGIDLVIAMDTDNYRDLQGLASASGRPVELRMMRSFDPALRHLREPHNELAVPDPYYGGDGGFVEVLAMLEAAADGLVAELPARLDC